MKTANIASLSDQQRPSSLPKTAAIVSIGDELMEGQYPNTNVLAISQRLATSGYIIKEQVTLGDDLPLLQRSLTRLFEAYDLVVTSGGLGPTADDKTREAVALALGQPLVHREASWQHIVQRMTCFNLTVRETDKVQALFPENATLLPNTCGTAYGFVAEVSGTVCVVLPGPPKEMQAMLDGVLPPNASSYPTEKRTHQWKLLGLTESTVQAFTQALDPTFNQRIKFLWVYPYLNITVEETPNDPVLTDYIAQLETYFSPHTVSKEGISASELIQALPPVNWLAKDPKLHNLMNSERAQAATGGYHIETQPTLSEVFAHQRYIGSFTIVCTEPLGKQHQITVPLRGPEVVDYIREYAAWVYSLSQGK